MSIRTRVGRLEKTVPIDVESLSLDFIADASGHVVAAKLPQLGLTRLKRIEGETAPGFRRRAHLELTQLHHGRSGPFYELLDNPTLEACGEALDAFLAAHDPYLLAELKNDGGSNA